MNKIVRNYPVDQLPADLQEGLPEHGLVEIEFRAKPQTPERVRLADLVGTEPNVHGTEQEVLNYIASIRADRDDVR